MRMIPAGVELVVRVGKDADMPLVRPVLVCGGACRGWSAHVVAPPDPNAHPGEPPLYECEECGSTRRWGW